MAGFDAGTVVDPLDWNFEAYGGRSGTIPEPAEKTVIIYQKKIQLLASKIVEKARAQGERPADIDTNEFLERLAKSQGEEAIAAAAELDKITGEFCKGHPTTEELAALPYRVKIAFFQWLQGELSPEALSAGGSRRNQANDSPGARSGILQGDIWGSTPGNGRI
jgi:hypothetical protein